MPADHQRPKTERTNIALTGFMGTGKSTVGRLLAAELDYEFVDTDDLIEAGHGPIPEIFKRRGEDGFRALEADAVRSLADSSGLVIATGGGLVTNEATAKLLEDIATVITLAASTETILSRVAADGATRPLLAGPSPDARVAELLAKRADAYGRYPQVDANEPAQVVAAAVLAVVFGESAG